MKSPLKWKTTIAGLVLALSLLLPFHTGAAQDLSVQDEETYRHIANGLMCQCGCGYLVHSCNHLDCPSATVIRTKRDAFHVSPIETCHRN